MGCWTGDLRVLLSLGPTDANVSRSPPLDSCCSAVYNALNAVNSTTYVQLKMDNTPDPTGFRNEHDEVYASDFYPF